MSNLRRVQVLQSQNAGAPKPTDDDQKTNFKQMDNNGAQHMTTAARPVATAATVRPAAWQH